MKSRFIALGFTCLTVLLHLSVAGAQVSSRCGEGSGSQPLKYVCKCEAGFEIGVRGAPEARQSLYEESTDTLVVQTGCVAKEEVLGCGVDPYAVRMAIHQSGRIVLEAVTFQPDEPQQKGYSSVGFKGGLPPSFELSLLANEELDLNVACSLKSSR